MITRRDAIAGAMAAGSVAVATGASALVANEPQEYVPFDWAIIDGKYAITDHLLPGLRGVYSDVFGRQATWPNAELAVSRHHGVLLIVEHMAHPLLSPQEIKDGSYRDLFRSRVLKELSFWQEIALRRVAVNQYMETGQWPAGHYRAEPA